MNVVVFGATGMVGHAAVIECLEDPGVTRVLGVVRRPSRIAHPEYVEVVHADFTDYRAIADQLRGLDVCLWCLGVSSVGMDEATYTRITYDYAVAAARALLQQNPALAFCFISGASTDGTEKGNVMWARVKGRTENAIQALTPSSWCFRPGFIYAEKSVVSATRWLRALYVVIAPLYPVLRALFPRKVTTSGTLGRAMLAAVRERPAKRVFECDEINALGAAAPPSPAASAA